MTADELIERWDARDARYARRRFHGRPLPVTPTEHDLIIAWRTKEVEAAVMEDDERRRALGTLLWWAPPEVTA